MEEKELICEYCKVPIKESDHKCPNCGADCTKTIRDYKKYQKEQTIAAQYATKEEINKTFKKTGNVIGATFIIMIFIVIAFIVGGIFLTYKVISNQFNSNTTATAGFKEKASTSEVVYTTTAQVIYKMMELELITKKPTIKDTVDCLRFAINHNIVTRLDKTIDNMGAQIVILPTILFTISNEKINAIFQIMFNRNNENEEANVEA